MSAPTLLTAVFLLVASAGRAQEFSKEDIRADIQLLKDSLPEKHPNLFFKISPEEFNASLDSISSRADTLSNFEIIMSLREAIAAVGDPHTNFGFYEAISAQGYFPIEIFWFSDGIYAMGSDERYQQVLGKKLVAINDVAIETVVNKVAGIVADEPYFRHKRMHYFLVRNGILNYYNITQGDSAKFTFQAPDGNTSEVMIKTTSDYEVDNFAYYHHDETPFYWQRVASDSIPFFRETYFEEDSLYFVQYNRCWSKEKEIKYGSKEEAEEMPSFEKFRSTVLETIRTKPIKKLFFDLRFNGGGNSIQGTELINELAEIEAINQSGRLYVAISPHTFSSAVINSMDFRLNTNATLIGTPTGGRPNHYGETRTLVLPRTQLEVYHSTRYFEYVDEDTKAVVPDKKVTTRFDSFDRKSDPLLDYAQAQPVGSTSVKR